MLPQRKEAFYVLAVNFTKLLSDPAAWLPTMTAFNEVMSKNTRAQHKPSLGTPVIFAT